MLRIVIVSLVLILSSLACNLASSTKSENTAIPLNQTISTQTPIVVTATSAMATATSQNNTVVNNVSTKVPTAGVNCYLKTDWFQYWVAAGDTLNKLAQRTKSTVAELTQANCLDDPNNLSIGQLLFLPRAPISTATPVQNTIPTPSPGGEQTGYVYFSNPLDIASRGVSLMPEDDIVLNYTTIPAEASYVEFNLRSTSGSVSSLGIDYDLSGGAMVTWTVPYGLAGDVVYATSYNNSGQVVRVSLTQAVYSNHTRNGYLAVDPYEKYEQGTYTLKANQTVTITWKQAPTTGRTSFIGIGFEGEKNNIGSADNTESGASFNWTVPGNIYPYALIYAISQRPDGTYAISQGYLSIEIVN